MLHQTVIVLLGWVSFGWTDAPLLKALAIAAATLVASLAGAAPVAGAGSVRTLFGMPAHTPARRRPLARTA
jgi:hypothetical protein